MVLILFQIEKNAKLQTLRTKMRSQSADRRADGPAKMEFLVRCDLPLRHNRPFVKTLTESPLLPHVNIGINFVEDITDSPW